MVDKTTFAPPMKLHSSCRNIVLRRPPGFGKTTLLSMLAAYVNLEVKLDDDLFPAADPESRVGRNALLVLSLDLSKLSFADGDSEEALLNHCNAFMNRELRRTAAQYHGLLHPTYGPRFAQVNSTWSFMVHRDQIFSAPVTDLPTGSVERATHRRHDCSRQLHHAF